MTLVRIYYHSQMEPAPAQLGTPREPYLGRSVLDVDQTPVSSDPAPAKATVALVQTTGPVHIEVCPPQREMMADEQSPILDGEKVYLIGPEWFFSVREAE